IYRGNNQTQSAAFHYSPSNEQAWIEVAPGDLAWLNELGLAQRLAIAQPTQVGPQCDADAVRLDLVKIALKIDVGRVDGYPHRVTAGQPISGVSFDNGSV